MASAGELLREERLKQNRSIHDVAKATCISVRNLEAIEANDLKALPGNFFYRSFLRQYAAALSIDDSATERILACAQFPSEPDPIPALNAAYTVAKDDARRNGFERPSLAVVLSLFFAALLGCSGLYALWNRSQVQKQADAPMPIVEKPTPAVLAPPAPVEEPRPAAEERPAAPSQSVGSSVDLAARDETWVTLSSEGKTLYAGVFKAEESKNFPIGESARLLTGNAGALDVRWNGKPLGPLGPYGRTRIVVFSPDDYEIQTPTKPVTRHTASRKATRRR